MLQRDAFIGEIGRPFWVWDLDNLDTNNPIVGIENDFIYNDPTDNPQKVGECISLPNNYANICLDLNTFEYDDYIIEYVSNVDLSEVNPDLKNEPAIFIHTSNEKGIILKPELYTNEIWVIGDGRVFYMDDKDDEIKYLKRVKINDEKLGIINEEDGLILSASLEQNYGINIKIDALDLKELFNVRFAMRWWNREIISLGDSSFFSEDDELTLHKYGEKTRKIGNLDMDLRTAYGIIVKNPNENSLSDKVHLNIPNKQLKAVIKVEYSNLISSKNPSDFDGDGCVKFPDFVLFAQGYSRFMEDGTYDGKFDLDNDGFILFSDFVIFAQNFGKCKK